MAQHPTALAGGASSPPINLAPPVLVDTSASFAAMMAALRGEPALALDTESDSLYRYFYKTCVIQISTPTVDYVVDPLRLRDLSPLGELMADAAVEKIFHAAENDILMLKRDFGFAFANIFDTMVAARILGWPRVGLAAILEERFAVKLDKRTQLTDWGQRPLTPEQLSYARLDSYYLPALRDLLAGELVERRRWREAQEAFAAACTVEFVEKPFDPEGFWRARGVRDMSPAELAVYRELYLWRDAQAREFNRPPFKVLGEDHLRLLSRDMPERAAELRLTPWQMRQFGDSLLAAIRRGRVAPAPRPPLRPHNGNGRPDPEVTARFDRLRAWRAQRAVERGVENDVILNNDTLMAVARAAPATADDLAALGVMGAWKLEEYGGELLRVVTGV